jgi:shikimate kinase
MESWGAGPERGITRIILVGFMAAGKSTVGRRVAEMLGWDFVDFDEEIERREGLPVPEIFRIYGQPAFRRMEAELTHDVAHLSGVVLAPGGGWITQPELLDAFGPETLVVWLRISPEEVVRRAARTLSHRPLLASAPDPLVRARTLIREREPLYRLADVVVDVDGRDVEDVAEEIAALALTS